MIFYKAVIRQYFIYETMPSLCFLFMTHENIRKVNDFLIFSGGIKRKQKSEKYVIKQCSANQILVAILLIHIFAIWVLTEQFSERQVFECCFSH